jgi:MFS family permease
MKGDLHFSDVAYGFGAGIFFISYSLFAVPSNLLMTRIGARRIIFASLMSWGLISAATMFIRTPMEFYIARLVLGAVESGFFPGIIFYFTLWYPSDRRAKVTGIFQSATVVAGILSGVLSGALLTYMNGYKGLRGWQWMFLLEGLPSSLMGIIVFFWLDDRPTDAMWLSTNERTMIQESIDRDRAGASTHSQFKNAAMDWRVYLLGVIFFFAVIGTYVLAFWQPIIIRELGFASPMTIGLLSTLPAAAAVLSKIWVGHRSDKRRELRWHFAVPALIGAIGLALMPATSHNAILGLTFLTLATAGVHGCIPVFWSLPGLYLSGAAAAGGIALVSTIGNTAGFVGPTLLGYSKSITGRFDAGLYMIAVLLTAGALLVLWLTKMPSDKKSTTVSMVKNPR